MALSEAPNNNTVSVVVCDSCQLVAFSHLASKRCSSCGDTLPAPLKLPSLKAVSRTVGTMAFLKPAADNVNAMLENDKMMSFRDHPTATDIVYGPTLCGWCSTQYAKRPQAPNCTNCGGLLPKPPGSDPGPLPPKTPRHLPKQFLQTVLLKKNPGLWAGLILAAVGIVYPLLLPVAAVVIYSGLVMPLRRRSALLKGVETLGVISHVARYKDNKTPIDQQASQGPFSVMYAVHFRFEASGELLEGRKFTYDPSVMDYMIGEPIWVVYRPKSLEAYDLWPPLA